MNKKIFLGGSRISSLQDKLPENIKAIIDSITSKNYTILIGDADGADKQMQEYLAINNYKHVEVYYSGTQIRNIADTEWKTKQITVSKDAKRDTRGVQMLKDKAMAEKADAGLMIWSDTYINKRFGNKCVSAGTLTNIANLLRNNKPVVVYYIPNKTAYTFNSLEDFKTTLYPIIDKLAQNKWQAIFKKDNEAALRLFD